jgi:hypothetical protein
MAGGDGHQLPGLEVAGRHLPEGLAGRHGRQPREQVIGVVVEPTGVVEQLPDGDALAARDDTGQPALQAIVQPQLALGDQLQHHGGHERLGHAADPEPVGGAGGPPGA